MDKNNKKDSDTNGVIDKTVPYKLDPQTNALIGEIKKLFDSKAIDLQTDILSVYEQNGIFIENANDNDSDILTGLIETYNNMLDIQKRVYLLFIPYLKPQTDIKTIIRNIDKILPFNFLNVFLRKSNIKSLKSDIKYLNQIFRQFSPKLGEYIESIVKPPKFMLDKRLFLPNYTEISKLYYQEISKHDTDFNFNPYE